MKSSFFFSKNALHIAGWPFPQDLFNPEKDRLTCKIAFLEKYFTILPFRAHAEYGTIRAALEKRGERLDDMDILIAATAVQESITLLTENKKHFARIPHLKTESWR